MNYFGHSCVTSQLVDDPHVIFGSMLPDFCGMAKAGPCDSSDPRTLRGLALHHQVDRHFHSAPVFLKHMANGAAILREQGVRKGAARAITHVGVELVLDGILMEDERFAEIYLRALQATEDVLSTLRKPSGERFQSLAKVTESVVTFGVPYGLQDMQRVASLLFRILGNRPRLAFTEEHIPIVRDWLSSMKTRLVGEAQPLFETMVEAVSSETAAPLGNQAPQQGPPQGLPSNDPGEAP